MNTANQRTEVVLVVNGGYGRTLVSAAEAIVGSLPVTIHDLDTDDSFHTSCDKIHQLFQNKNQGKGVLVLTDLCGSTPSNICFASIEKISGCEIVTGINLPMLLKLATCDLDLSPKEIAQALLETGRRSIVIGSNLRLPKGTM